MTPHPTRVLEIEERLKAATHGPWKNSLTTRSLSCVVDLNEFHICDIERGVHYTGDTRPDAELIASAPSDLADLLAELRRRDQALAVAKDALDFYVRNVSQTSNVHINASEALARIERILTNEEKKEKEI